MASIQRAYLSDNKKISSKDSRILSLYFSSSKVVKTNVWRFSDCIKNDSGTLSCSIFARIKWKPFEDWYFNFRLTFMLSKKIRLKIKITEITFQGFKVFIDVIGRFLKSFPSFNKLYRCISFDLSVPTSKRTSWPSLTA